MPSHAALNRLSTTLRVLQPTFNQSDRSSRWGGLLDVVFPSLRDEAAAPTRQNGERIKPQTRGGRVAVADGVTIRSSLGFGQQRRQHSGRLPRLASP